jgi:putative ABC transport system permease protein
MTLGERIYRAALATCPQPFRAEYGEDSVRDFVRLAEQTRRMRGRSATAWLTLRATVDLIRTGVRERRGSRTRPSPMLAIPQHLADARRNVTAKPGFTLMVVTTLALGIGANSAVFDIVYAVILKPLPLPDSTALVMLFETDTSSDGGAGPGDVAPANFEDWRALSGSFVDLAAMTGTSMNLTGAGEPERLSVHRVSSSLFTVLGVEPVLGRAFAAEEDRPGAARVALLSHGFWLRRFGARESVVGEDLLLDDEPHRVIGVLPAWLGFPSRDTEVFVPLAMEPEERGARTSHYLAVVGRVRDGVSVAQAADEMSRIAAQLAELYPDSNADNGVKVTPLREHLLGDHATPLLVLLAAVSAILLIAVVNVANLMVAQSATRRKEVAVRTALGASGSRILGQLMTEAAVVALAGACVGFVFAIWARRLLVVLTPTHVTLDASWWRPATLGVALILAAAAAVGMGIGPALSLSRTAPGRLVNLKSSSSRTGTKLPSVLIVGEVAIAFVLLAVGALMLRSFVDLSASHPGFRAENVLTVRIELSGSRYQEHAQKVAFYRELVSRVSRLPDVQSAGFVTMMPLTLSGGSIYFEIEGRTPSPKLDPIAVFRSVTPGYFRALGVPLLEGRDFDDRDRKSSPQVAVVNRTLARRFFGGESALGKRLVIWGAPAAIVGVVADVHELTVGEDARPAIYVAAGQRSFGFFDPRDFAVHTRGDPLAIVPAVRAEVWSIDAEQPIGSIRTMEDIVSAAVASERLQTSLLTTFGAVALVLAALGIYGVLTHTVSQRTDEIGLRMALGARAADVVGLVAGRGIGLAAAGLTLGLVVSFGLGRALEGMLYGIGRFDFETIAAVAGLLSAVVLAACLIPALRASRIDPLETLTEE